MEEKVKKDDISQTKGYSIASLVLGIVSVVFALTVPFISIASGILAIIFGILGKKRAGKGMAKAGFILGIIGISSIVLFLIIGVCLTSVAFSAIPFLYW